MVEATVKGQHATAAPSIIGDWIIIQTNGIGSKEKASSVVAVHQKDPKRMTTIFPFGELKSGEMSFAPPKPQTDPENSMVYSADVGMGKVAGITIDQTTGEILAQSDFFEPLTPNSLTTPGFGGRVYFPTEKGFIVLQVRQKAKLQQ
ncbi:hypothetical protein [Desulfomonile tiedjei]|uniref:Uncharacterized protein n=1 Tax=Desulfomonile tiedjei (strain ATCC 49306 / DSM 6799 / DCB-1) TaxID=706587 RepID=I4C9H4_DESTA|nr:hypothetical protein [Desulfomonile tiedjei]AFM26215.1 hypothetical protein Desti_3566 [Desulfomonile tiedjei DSM 6799]